MVAIPPSRWEHRMQQRVSLITLGVADLARSCAFYDRLGWSRAAPTEGEDIVAYDLIGMTLALYPRTKLAEDATQTFGEGPSPFTLAHNVAGPAEVDAVLATAVAAGGKLVKPAAAAFWGGYSGYVADPDGFLWEIAHNPFAPLGPNGEFQWNGTAA